MNGAILFYLGHAYQGAKRHEEALNAYFRAETLGYADKGLAYNIGGTYWQAGDYARAAEWFQKAIEQTPDWAQPRFHLGQALKRLGDIAAARQVWEEVLTLDDDEYVKRGRGRRWRRSHCRMKPPRISHLAYPGCPTNTRQSSGAMMWNNPMPFLSQGWKHGGSATCTLHSTT